MKRFIALICLIALLLALSGCGKDINPAKLTDNDAREIVERLWPGIMDIYGVWGGGVFDYDKNGLWIRPLAKLI